MTNILDIVEKHYELIRPELATEESLNGRPRCNELAVLQGILWVLRSGARWKDLPDSYPSYQTCHRRFQLWVKLGVFRRLLRRLVKEAGIDLSEVYVDGSFAPAKKGGGKVGKCLKGKGSKLLVLLSRNELPVSIQLESASPHEVSFVPQLVKNRLVSQRITRIIGDKAYDSDPLDKMMRSRGIEIIAPNRDCRLKKNQDGRALRRIKRRWSIERYFSWLKNYRRLATRWEYNPNNYEGFALLACITLVLRTF